MENMRGRGRGRRTRGRGRGAIRNKKNIAKKEELVPSGGEEDEVVASSPPVNNFVDSPTQVTAQVDPPPPLDMEADISQLEAPTFTTLSRGPPEPMLRLDWSHSVNLIGEKVLNPMIHCCDTCLRPILIYGRMIPCKHVFCLACAHRDAKQCARCKDKVLRVEQTGLGTVFMCTHGGSRYGNKGCRRTYLSQRDLQAHINHRHVASSTAAPNVALISQISKGDKPPALPVPPGPAPFYEPTKMKLFEETESYGIARGLPDAAPVAAPGALPALAIRPPGNLITVSIQEPPAEPYFNAFNQPPPMQPQQPINYFPPTFDYPPPDTSVPPPPPPNQWPSNPPFYG